DYGWNLVRAVVQVLYWPHPLTWFLGRIIGAVREQACDDFCVHVMGGSTEYRATLLEVASGLVQRPDPALGLAMARPSNLGRRLAWIDRGRGVSRCLMRWPSRFALLAAVVTAAGLIGSIEFHRAKAQGPSNEPPATSSKATKDAAANLPQAIEVVVLGKDTGKPLEGATVRASLDFDRVETRTDHEGMARLDLSGRPALDSISLDVWVDGYVQQRHFFSQTEDRYPKIPERVDVTLWPAEETIGGTVTDEQGRPIAGVTVKIWGDLGEKKDKSESAYMVDATTDELGRWRSRCFRDLTFARLYLSYPDYLDDNSIHPRRYGGPDSSSPAKPDDQPLQALRDFKGVQVMKNGVAIAGTVVDEQGKPVQGAEVAWLEIEQQPSPFRQDLTTTTTNAGGRFRFSNVQPGSLLLQVIAHGHAPTLKTVEAGPKVEPVSITLEPSRTIAGRVVDSQGNPIPGVVVSVPYWRGYRSLSFTFKTDADGRFRWDDAPTDSVTLVVRRVGFEILSQQRVPPDQENVVLTLKRALFIEGKVRDAETDQPIDIAQVEVGIPDPKTGAIAWSENHFASVNYGSLQVTLDAEKVPAYQLRIKAKGYEPFESRTFRSDEGEVKYDVKLTSTDKPQGTEVSGVVSLKDGTPLKEAEVMVTYPNQAMSRLPNLQLENGTIQPFPDRTIVKTDAQGRFSMTREPDPKGQYYAVVVVHPDAFAKVDRAAFEADSTIIANPWGRIEGVARVGSKLASGAAIRYYGDNLAHPDVPYMSIKGTTTADAEGRFALDHVAPGDVRVSRA
ncbi:MAG: carboxypeptidase regulatory-like domain-containing protein, partial [Isosphaeraceae bacterium]